MFLNKSQNHKEIIKTDGEQSHTFIQENLSLGFQTVNYKKGVLTRLKL